VADALVGRALSSLINGVSQQPSHIRLPSQGTAQENVLSKVVEGITRRPPSEHVVKLINAAEATGGYHVHIYDRDGTEQYVIFLSDNAKPAVYDFAGNAATVSEPDGHAYMNFDTAATNAKDAFRAITVGDTTFIVNKTITCAMSGSVTTARPFEFLFVAREHTNIGTNTLKFGSTAVEWSAHTIPSTSIDNLYTALGAAGLTGAWTFTKINAGGSAKASILHGVQTSGTAYTTMTFGDHDGNSGRLIFRKVQRFSDLPSDASDGFLAEIVGSDGDIEDNYWVAYDADEHAWVETVAPELDNAYDADTMPFRLVRTAVSPLAFTFEQIPWEDRTKGDAISAPEPAFIGAPIRDVFFHKNRLGFLADENAILSEANEYFNFWIGTATAVLDSDSFERSGAGNRVAFLDWAEPYNKELSLFSARGGVQQELRGVDGILTPADALIVDQAFYPSSQRVRPRSIGRSLYFVSDRDTASGVFEYKAVGADRVEVHEITSHVPSYIPGNIWLFAASQIEQTLVLVSEDEPNAVWVYRFHISEGDQAAMRGWSKWTLGATDNIIGMHFIDSVLYLVVERDDPAIFLEKIDFRKLTDGGFTHRIHLDSLVELTGVYSAVTDLTTWTLPYEAITGEDYLVVLSHADWTDQLGRVLNSTATPGSVSVTVVGDWSAAAAHLGRVYVSTYTFSPAVVEQKQGSANAALSRLYLKRWYIAFDDTAYFRTIVTLSNEESSEELIDEFTGRNVSGISFVLGPPVLSEGIFGFSAGGESRFVVVSLDSGSSYAPWTVTSAEWEGLFTQRARQV